MRQLLVFAVCLPLAIMVGFLAASPENFNSIAIIGLLFCLLSFPLLLKFHYFLLICAWNASIIVFFLPGQPSLVVALSATSLLLALIARALQRRKRFIHVPSIAWSLVFIAVVVGVTAKLTGGIAGQSMGGEMWGAKRYIGIFGAVLGYFALTSQVVPEGKRKQYASLFFLSGTTAIVSDIIFAVGPSVYFLFALFPSDLAVTQAFTQDSLMRLTGVAFAALSGCYFLVMRYGIRGICDWRKPWRGGFFFLAVSASLLGGYRSCLVIILLIFIIQFYFEGLFKTRFLFIFALGIVLIGGFLVGFADKLPLSIQRSLSILPIKVDSSAKRDAQGTLDWRFEMWKVLWPEIPQYLLLGKGFTYSGTDYYLTQVAAQNGTYAAYEHTLISGNYHNGLLTIIIPFGIWGVFGFLWFCMAALRVLYLNFCFGDDSIKNLNRFLLSYFVARLLYYLIFYGQFDSDLILFVGIVGFSLALNGGVCSRAKSKYTIAAGLPDVIPTTISPSNANCT